MKFLKKSIKHRFTNLAEDSEIVANKIEEHTSFFYASKSSIQATGFALGFFAPWGIVQTIGWSTAGGIFAVDYIFDWLAGMPQTRRWIRKFKARFNGMVNEEEEGLKRIRYKVQKMMEVNDDVMDL